MIYLDTSAFLKRYLPEEISRHSQTYGSRTLELVQMQLRRPHHGGDCKGFRGASKMTELVEQIVKEVTGADQIFLFGSRARGTFSADSDYDVLAILPSSLGQRERRRLSTRCRQRLAQLSVDADVLVKSPDEIKAYQDKRGSIVHEALRTGIPL